MEGAVETAGLPPALAAIGRAAVVPVVREDSAARAVEVARWAVEQGLDVVELTATIPDWRTALRELRDHAPGVTLGIGTLRNRADAEAAVAEGAEFLVTPHPAPEVRAVADAHGTPSSAADSPRPRCSRRPTSEWRSSIPLTWAGSRSCARCWPSLLARAWFRRAA